MAVHKRVINSKKFWEAVVGVFSAVTVNVFGWDPSGDLTTLIGTVTSLLVGGQAAIDFKHGSKSDQAQ